MEFKTITLPSACDNLDLDILYVVPSGTIKGLVQLSHGMAEHKERYRDFMSFLADRGYLVFINDHRGHGESVKNDLDYGYFYDQKGDYIVNDLYHLSLYFKKEYPGLPLYLFGHSMGSLVVRKYLQHYDDTIDKLIVCGSPSRNPLVKFALLLTDIMIFFKGDRYRSPLINDLAFGSFDKRFAGDLTNRWLSVNEENVKEYNQSKKNGFIFTLNGFRNLFSLMADVYDKHRYQVKKPELPILFIAGKDDPVIGSMDKWHQAIMFLKKCGYKDVEGIAYADRRHEILNEKERLIVYKDVGHFMEK